MGRAGARGSVRFRITSYNVCYTKLLRIAKAFEYAHEADPDAILRYNDYGLENADKRRKLITLIKSLKEQGVPVMAIGTQAHLNVSSASFENMDETLTEIATLGLPIHVTELDINSYNFV